MNRRPMVLISDDEPMLVSAFAREARRNGITVITDTRSDDIVALAKSTQPDLIVLDVHQKVDGRVLLGRLKREPKTHDIPVIMLSGVEDQLTRHMCLSLGAVDYDVKPWDPVFMRKVMRLVGVDPSVPAVLLPA